ncbi:putative F-box protein At4g38870 [Rutidosis leptorrhynchoides]|uniref:putative F-box protein At4g38870 n=1 Tax=Rutidosis leptorrhynchoides TaxID=125765 RepID=UPI003A99C3A9
MGDIRRLSKKKNIMAGDQQLPVDIIYNILSRMPLKSLARFQCVSKVWYKYINDPYLEIMHNKQRVIEDPRRRMLIMLELFPYPNIPIKYISENSIFKSELKEILLTQEEEEVDSRTPINAAAAAVMTAAYMKFWCIPGSCKYKLGDFVLGSCKGLLLYSPQTYRHGKSLHVINPLKRECYKVPPIKIGTCRSIGLGFDDSTNTLKIVCVVIRHPKIDYSRLNRFDNLIKEGLCCTMVHDVVLGGTDSWREIPLLVPPYDITLGGVFANGCLHWLGLGYGPLIRKVVFFDMAKEEFGSIDAPPNTRSLMDHLVDLDGQVGLVCYDDNSRCIKVWRLLKETTTTTTTTTKSCWVIHCCFDYFHDILIDDRLPFA